uniref:Uncharacterized protein n=1 Tax=Oryza rufipogon TaxID=4529 RepID=A0A0E0MSV2_ORYRU
MARQIIFIGLPATKPQRNLPKKEPVTFKDRLKREEGPMPVFGVPAHSIEMCQSISVEKDTPGDGFGTPAFADVQKAIGKIRGKLRGDLPTNSSVKLSRELAYMSGAMSGWQELQIYYRSFAAKYTFYMSLHVMNKMNYSLAMKKMNAVIYNALYEFLYL